MVRWRLVVLAALFLCLIVPSPASASLVGAPQESGLVTVHAPSGPDVSTTSGAWVAIPHMKGAFTLASASTVTLTLCAEAETAGGGRLFVRALLDGATAAPSDVVFAAGAYSGTRCFTFAANGVAAGVHSVRMQWLVDAGSTGYLGDRTLTIAFAKPGAAEMALLAVAAPSGATLNAGTSWADVPGLAGTVQLAAESDLSITITAEAFTDSGRLFVRALVDGAAAGPSDAVLVAGGFSGVRSFTFVAPSIAAGSHDVRLQWHADGANQGHFSDRVLAVTAVSTAGGATLAGRLDTAAPSGALQSTTSTSWVDVPNLGGAITVPQTGDLAIGVSAEVFSSAAGMRVFLRALLDGTPVSPSDVVLAGGTLTGSFGYTFVARNVERGSHVVQVQWSVDSGATAYAGDRTLAAFSFARQQPMMVVGIESDRPAGYAMGGLWADSVVDTVGGVRSFKPYVLDRIWGGAPGVADYFLENSGGRYFLVEGGLLGPFKKYLDEKTYRETVPDPFTTMQLEALGYADVQFDFSLYDRDGDGWIRNDELLSMVILYQDSTDGFVRALPNMVTNDGVSLDLGWVPHAYLEDFQQADQIGVLTHELAHVFFDAGDMYENATTIPSTGGWDPTAPGGYSLMDNDSAHPHLDAYHKLHAGNWYDPIVVTRDGYYDVPAVEGSPVIYRLADPGSHAGEFFLVENRRNLGYDQYLPDRGIAIWHIDEARLPDYRTAVEIEPACGPTDPLRWGEYLYDGAGSLWGRDFWGGGTPLNARWHDGSPSGIGVWAIPETADTVSVYLDVPGPGLLVDVAPATALQLPGEPANFLVRLVNTGPATDTFNLSATAAAGGRTWSQNPVTLGAYQEAIVALSVEPVWGSQMAIPFTVMGQSASDASVATYHIATVSRSFTMLLPLVRRGP